ncbi:hypothetical protein Taro_047654 [Colocasia esculenta]|uniref:Uncharacterized protein n=1 Tax=Colocasia esculenta TaxID=4460 RepID=A0A843WWM6_COLES|nr:hypothetical protein [Colocasia esculenta]
MATVRLLLLHPTSLAVRNRTDFLAFELRAYASAFPLRDGATSVKDRVRSLAAKAPSLVLFYRPHFLPPLRFLIC